MPVQRRMPPPFSSQEDIQYFVLDGLFPQGHAFAFHHSLSILTHLSCAEQVSHPLLLGEQQFSGRECDLLLPLLTNYPHFSPYEILYVSFYQGFHRLAEDSILQAKQRLDELRAEEGLWDAEIRPMRNVISRLRLKLRKVGLDTVCMLEVGYMLIRNPKW